MAVTRQFRDAVGQGGHGGEICAGQMRIGDANTNIAFTKKQQFHEGKGVNAGLGQRAVFIKFLSLGYEVVPRELAKFGGNFLWVCFRRHYDLIIL